MGLEFDALYFESIHLPSYSDLLCEAQLELSTCEKIMASFARDVWHMYKRIALNRRSLLAIPE
jgi:hypothetical protein